MADNVTVDNGTGTDYGVASDKITYSGDADQAVQLVKLVTVSGSEGSKTATDVTTGVQYVEDSAITANLGQGTLVVARRDDALSTLTPAADDAVGLRVNDRGALWVQGESLSSFDTAAASPLRATMSAVAQPDQRFTSVALGTAANSVQAWDANGADTMLVHLATTQTGTMTFEVSADGTNWVGAEFRDVALDLWASGTSPAPTANKVYRVITNGWRSMRARTVTTLNGTVALTATVAARSTVVNALDSGPAPHNFGYTPWFAGADISTGTTTNIKTPTSGRRLVVTKVTLGTGSTTAGLVTVWLAASGDTTVNLGTDDVMFRGVLTPTANATPGVILDFPNNPPVGTVDYLLKVTTAAATTLYVTARGYEIP